MKTTTPSRPLVTRASLALIAALLLGSWSCAQAQPDPDAPDQPRPPHRERPPGDRPQPRLAPGFQPGGQPGQGMPVMERVLTPDQRESLREITEAQREQTRDTQEKIRDARKALLKAALDGDFDKKAVKAKAKAVAELEAELTVLRLKAMSQVQPPLSKDQIARILNPPPMQRMNPADGERPPNRRPNRPPGGPRDEPGQPAPPREPQ